MAEAGAGGDYRHAGNRGRRQGLRLREMKNIGDLGPMRLTQQKRDQRLRFGGRCGRIHRPPPARRARRGKMGLDAPERFAGRKPGGHDGVQHAVGGRDNVQLWLGKGPAEIQQGFGGEMSAPLQINLPGKTQQIIGAGGVRGFQNRQRHIGIIVSDCRRAIAPRRIQSASPVNCGGSDPREHSAKNKAA